MTKDGFLCPFNGTGEKSGGTYVDSAVIGASAEEEAVFLKVDKQTKLCDKSVAACPFLNTYGARKIAGTLKAGTKAEFVFDWNKAERTPKCEKSTFSGATEKEAGVPLLGSLATLTFGACEAACAVTAKGLPYRMEFRASAVVGNGQLSLVSTGFGDPEVEIDCGEIVCSYFGRVWVSKVKGGANGEIQVSEVLARTGAAGKCEGNLTWTATYTITEPAPLYVTN